MRACELNDTGYYTVNSSPYAKGVYEHLGFETIGDEQCINGLRFFPMINKKVKDYLLSNNETVNMIK